MQDQRVIYNAIDISGKVNDFRSGVQALAYTAGSYLYVGASVPFNNLWIELGTVNSVSTTVPTVKIWFGNTWVDAVDLIDDTAAMTQTGRLSWSTDIQKSWDYVQSSEIVSGLSAFKIYWKYWARISWSQSFSGGTTVKYIGQKFSIDDVLYSFYPDLSNSDLLAGFETGKTSWDEQHYMAAEHIIRDLTRRGIIKGAGQVIDWTLLEAASCHKVAEIAYKAFGKPYEEQLKLARADYEEALNVKFPSVDVNLNGQLDPVELGLSTQYGTR